MKKKLIKKIIGNNDYTTGNLLNLLITKKITN